jgi:hypothetical protein
MTVLHNVMDGGSQIKSSDDFNKTVTDHDVSKPSRNDPKST